MGIYSSVVSQTKLWFMVQEFLQTFWVAW